MFQSFVVSTFPFRFSSRCRFTRSMVWVNTPSTDTGQLHELPAGGLLLPCQSQEHMPGRMRPLPVWRASPAAWRRTLRAPGVGPEAAAGPALLCPTEPPPSAAVSPPGGPRSAISALPRYPSGLRGLTAGARCPHSCAPRPEPPPLHESKAAGFFAHRKLLPNFSPHPVDSIHGYFGIYWPLFPSFF